MPGAKLNVNSGYWRVIVLLLTVQPSRRADPAPDPRANDMVASLMPLLRHERGIHIE